MVFDFIIPFSCSHRLLVGIDEERAVLLTVERAQALERLAGFGQLGVLADDLDDVGLLFYFFDYAHISIVKVII